jgi:hypothetical protein
LLLNRARGLFLTAIGADTADGLLRLIEFVFRGIILDPEGFRGGGVGLNDDADVLANAYAL